MGVHVREEDIVAEPIGVAGCWSCKSGTTMLVRDDLTGGGWSLWNRFT